MNVILMFIVILSASFSVFYSFKTRSYRKKNDFKGMKYYNAKANMSMGIMLISMAIIQLFTFSDDVSGWRISVGIVFLLLGSFNLLIGIRNYRMLLPEIKK